MFQRVVKKPTFLVGNSCPRHRPWAAWPSGWGGEQPHTMWYIGEWYIGIRQTLPWTEVQVNVIKIHTLAPQGVKSD